MTRKASSAIRTALRNVLPEALVNSLARETGAVQRQGKVKIYVFVCNLVLGFGCGDKRTIAGLRRSYERAARHTIEESAFYKRFSPGLVELLKKLVDRSFDQLVGVGRSLRGPLAQFRDAMLTDSTVVRLNDLLSKRFPACRTNHTTAALKAHVVLSVRGAGGSSLKITSERKHDGPVFKVGGWVKDRLLLFDLGYFRYHLFESIHRHGGFFITRLKKTANPLIVSVHAKHRGRDHDLVGQRLHDVIDRLDREVVDIEVEIEFSRRRYAGRRRRARQRLRIVGLKNAETCKYHLYITNVPPNRLSAEDVGIIYALRWQIELLFKELKTYFRLEDMPSTKVVVVESLLYAAMLTLVASRRLLSVVREYLRGDPDRLPTQRWAAVLISIAQDLLLAVTWRIDRIRQTLTALTRVLLHEAVDPNHKRHGLLRTVETGLRYADATEAAP